MKTAEQWREEAVQADALQWAWRLVVSGMNRNKTSKAIQDKMR
jgi:hypothetical protein